MVRCLRSLACLWCLGALAACGYLPASRECAYVRQQLGAISQLKSSQVECAAGLFANDGVTARVEMNDGSVLEFERLGFNAFSSNATSIVLAQASGLRPRVASCDGVASPNFHRDAALGPHLRPTLIDTKEAVSRYRELQEEVEFWPQCPQYYEVENRVGARFHYCARKPSATDEPPRPDNCGA